MLAGTAELRTITTARAERPGSIVRDPETTCGRDADSHRESDCFGLRPLPPAIPASECSWLASWRSGSPAFLLSSARRAAISWTIPAALPHQRLMREALWPKRGMASVGRSVSRSSRSARRQHARLCRGSAPDPLETIRDHARLGQASSAARATTHVNPPRRFRFSTSAARRPPHRLG